jgi:hypothetical protein
MWSVGRLVWCPEWDIFAVSSSAVKCQNMTFIGPSTLHIILPVVLYGCETWSLTLSEEHGLGVFENRVLRRIFGPKRDEVTGEWRKLHNEELHDLYSSPSILRMVKARRVRWAGYVARGGKGTPIGCWWESQREGGR